MANSNPETPNQDFLQQLLDMQTFAAGAGAPNLVGTNMNLSSGGGAPLMLQLNSLPAGFHGSQPVFPLGLSLDEGLKNGAGFLKPGEVVDGAAKRFHDDNNNNNQLHHHFIDGVNNSVPNNVFHGQQMSNPVPMAPQQPAVRPRVRARRGQATDPHSIAERLRRERIAERIRALQELVPSVNKTDRAAMLDEIVDYVKFLRLQVKVLSMSRLGGAGAVVPLVTDMPISSVEDEGGEGGRGQPVWEKCSNDGTEKQVAKLMEENVGAAMQFLQSKALCIMPVSLASAIYQTQPPDAASLLKPESNPPS